MTVLTLIGVHRKVNAYGSNVSENASVNVWIKRKLPYYTHGLKAIHPDVQHKLTTTVSTCSYILRVVITYSEINYTLAFVCKTLCNHILLEIYNHVTLSYS